MLPTRQEQHARYNASEKGRKRRRDYRHNSSKWMPDVEYLSRPFLAWDGEGITRPDGSHVYVLLANSAGAYISDPEGLATWRCVQFLLTEAAKHPGAINIGYGLGYDTNMIFKDFTREDLWRVYTMRFPKVGGYRFDWRQGKSLYVTDSTRAIMLFDVSSFFQCAFIKACDSYLGADWHERDLIVKNKALRSSFTEADLPEVLRYNAAELVNLVALMRELRERLNKVGLRPKRWDGPGAIAAALLQRERVKDAMATQPPEVAKAARYAYAGGRFEVIKYGSVEGAAYEYDVNSAYPSALRDVPDLRYGHWEHYSYKDPGSHPYALYHIDYNDRSNITNYPGPLFCRTPNGMVAYPMHVRGWYWSPEVDTLRDYCRTTKDKDFYVIEAYVYVPDDPDNKPFEFVERLYAKRRALKRGGDGAHVGLKLGLNSLYGKLAQQVGWVPAHDGKPNRLPPFHQLEWAGYVTSHCRAAVFRAAMQDPEAVIAFETDALFTSRPLNLPLGDDLGEWEETRFSQLTYVQSGTYFGTLSDGTTVTAKTRGVDLGTLTHEAVLAGLANPVPTAQVAEAQMTRFVGAGVALTQSFKRWCRWEVQPKVVKLSPQGKRDHIAMASYCDHCDDGGPLKLGVWHQTYATLMHKLHSSEFPVEWINPDPDMDILGELREGHYDEGWGD